MAEVSIKPERQYPSVFETALYRKYPELRVVPRSGLVAWHDLYDPTESLASVPDLSGNGYDLQRGSTAEADSNDPTWITDGKGLSFDTDDYCLTDDLSGVTMAGDFSLIVLAANTSTLNYATLVALGTYADDHHRQTIQTLASGGLRIGTKEGESNLTSPKLATAVSPCAYVAQNLSGTLSLQRLDTGDRVTIASVAPVGTPIRLGVGTRADGRSLLDSGTAYEILLYNRALSDAEIQRIYHRLKATWAARGVTIL